MVDRKENGEQIGERLRRVRVETGRSLRKVSTALGYSPTYLSYLENGKVSPSSQFLVRFALEFGLDVDELFVSAGLVAPDVLEALSSDADLVRYVRQTIEDMREGVSVS